MRVVLNLIVMVLICCCSTDLEPQALEPNFFPIKDFFEKEGDRIGGKKSAIKFFEYNGEKDTLELSEFKPKNDLRSFINSDINNPTWGDKYQADTIVNGKEVIYRYSSMSAKLKTKRIEVYNLNDEVSKIYILNADSSVFKSYREELSYQPDKGYQINLKHKINKKKENSSLVKVVYK